jgi:hypothetical protein
MVGVTLDRSLNRAQEYLDKYVKLKLPQFVHASSTVGGSSVAAEIETSVDESMRAFVKEKTSKRARVTKAAFRLHDALGSLNWMLSSLAPEDFNEHKRDAVVKLLSTVNNLLPSCQKNDADLYGRILTKLSTVETTDRDGNNSGSNLAQTQKAIDGIAKLISQHSFSLNPNSCIAQSVKTTRNRADISLALAPVPTTWLVCKSLENHLPKFNKETDADLGSGYTCGIWLLFHYLTGPIIQYFGFCY